MILCCGEALIDMLPEQTVSGHRGFVPHPGGSVFNTAIALGRIGVPAALLTGLSTDMFGKKLRAALQASQVDTSLVIASGRPTTLAFVQLSDGHARYDFFDENSAGSMVQPSDMPTIPAGVEALFFGGISLACEPGADAYAGLLAQEGGRRAVMLDPNIRPGFIEHEKDYRARLERMITQADIVKVSDEDLKWIAPGALPVRDKASALLNKGPALVIVTQGGDGATGFCRGGGEIWVPVQKVDVIDTVGAGDTFNAGVLAGFAKQGILRKDKLARLTLQNVERALILGARVAGVTVSRAGANPPWADEI